MILGIGSDLVDIRRIGQALLRHGPRFEERVFTPGERSYARNHAHCASTYAKRFAAKEACAKALGSGFRGGLALRDIEVVRDANGRPSLELHGRAAQALQELLPAAKTARIHLTLTDEFPYAQAFVVIEAVPVPPLG